jgi:hypothetical protein
MSILSALVGGSKVEIAVRTAVWGAPDVHMQEAPRHLFLRSECTVYEEGTLDGQYAHPVHPVSF